MFKWRPKLISTEPCAFLNPNLATLYLSCYIAKLPFPYHSFHSAAASTYRHVKQRYGSLCLLEILENYLLPARPRWLWSDRSWMGGGRSPRWSAASQSPASTELEFLNGFLPSFFHSTKCYSWRDSVFLFRGFSVRIFKTREEYGFR